MISIVIVNYNAGELLHSCLESIYNQSHKEWEVIIVDNASIDGSLSNLGQTDSIKIIRNQINVGFAIAQNQGLKKARGEYLMPLNYDTFLSPDFLHNMINAIESDSGIGSVTSKFLYMKPDGIFTNRIYAVGHLLPPNRFPLLRGTDEIDEGQFNNQEFIFGAPGAAPLYRRECLEDVAYKGQYFDETFFMWSEDVDLDWRIMLRGWKCLYTPEAIAYHVGHPTGYDPKFNRFRVIYSIRNRWAMITANEISWDFFKNWVPLLRYELSLLFYVIRFGLLISYLKACVLYVKALPAILEKRRWIQSRIVRYPMHMKSNPLQFPQTDDN